ncbi:two-component system response regulator [Piscinibacter gummiphilus]|uniref:Two-component system response regulator n=1 Tax=Piscinibacter gummiphilus TaxID=946333 RepID=A0ABZ0CT07_9BURK|nr:two-component system response regulator [Piscinibacter gummiphilus]WOB06013.1 two-component system response regulator [Piscinibacter gummiphilus]
MSQETILIVDDSPENLTVLGELLKNDYRVLAATDGLRALQLAARQPGPDLILLDVMMPEMNGYQVLAALQATPETRDIPVIFTTAMCATEAEEQGLHLGAADYITKPLRPAIVLARVQTHLALKRARDALKRDKAGLEKEVLRQMQENRLIQDVAMRALARLAETRDNETGNHILRTQEYVQLLAQRARLLPQFCDELSERSVALIAKSAPLHDIGKVGIPDRILLKPGKLTADEWEVMKTHAALGADAIGRAVADLQQPPGFLMYATQIARHHHERWDGTGYPDRLAGNAIPLAARLMAIADVFDALISRRSYKAPMPPAVARETMAAGRGRQFDPVLLDIFLEAFDEFCEIARRRPDDADEVPAAEPAPAQPATEPAERMA